MPEIMEAEILYLGSPQQSVEAALDSLPVAFGCSLGRENPFFPKNLRAAPEL